MGNNYAYVWLLMMGDNYLPGILVSAYSLKKTNTKYDLVVLITNDVSQHAINELNKIFDNIVKVEYIIKEYQYKNKKEKRKYPWMNKIHTKWNCLNLTQ